MKDKPKGKAYGIPAEDEPGLIFDLFVCYIYEKIKPLPIHQRKAAFLQLTAGTKYQIADIHHAVTAKFKRDEENENRFN